MAGQTEQRQHGQYVRNRMGMVQAEAEPGGFVPDIQQGQVDLGERLPESGSFHYSATVPSAVLQRTVFLFISMLQPEAGTRPYSAIPFNGIPRRMA